MCPNNRKAFTLVELLVVIGIIALLISILLPTLGKAREAASSIKCEANLRSIMQGVQMYASQNRDWIPGASTSGLYLLAQNDSYSIPKGPYGENNSPDLITMTDWMSPVAITLGIKFNRGPLSGDRADRYMNLVAKGMFHCPSNTDDMTVPRWTGSTGADLGILPIPSYFEAVLFTFVHTNSALPAGVGSGSAAKRLWGVAATSSNGYDVPAGYTPKISKIRNATQKISFADGSRDLDGKNAPDYDSNISAGSGGMFADFGPWTKQWGYAIYRGEVPGNGTGTFIFDGRLGLRHGSRKSYSAGGTYKGNAAFWDGHVETLNDLDMSNPDYWMPTGTQYDSTQLWPDTNAKFGPFTGVKAAS